MNKHLPILMSVLMLSSVYSKCIQIIGSTACSAFNGSYISTSKDFNDEQSFNDFVLKRVGEANSIYKNIYIQSFRSSYGCPKYNGDRQEHAQTMLCAQIVADSLPICQKPMAKPLCQSTCRAAIKNIVSIFKSDVCRSSDKANWSKIKRNKDWTVAAYHQLCYNKNITAKQGGCIIDANTIFANDNTKAPELTVAESTPTADAVSGAESTTIADAGSVSPESTLNPRTDAGASLSMTEPPTVVDTINLPSAAPPLTSTAADIPINADTLAEVSEAAEISSTDQATAAITDSVAQPPNDNPVDSQEKVASELSSEEKTSNNQPVLWSIIGATVGLIMASVIGYVIYQRRKSPVEENLFKGNPKSVISHNSFVTGNDGVVAREYYPEMPDEVVLNVGDRIDVLESFDDGWALGENITTGFIGVFPLQCIQPGKNDGSNPGPSTRMSSLYSIGKFYG